MVKVITIADKDKHSQMLFYEYFHSLKKNVKINFVDNEEQLLDSLRGNFPFANQTENPLPELILINLEHTNDKYGILCNCIHQIKAIEMIEIIKYEKGDLILSSEFWNEIGCSFQPKLYIKES